MAKDGTYADHVVIHVISKVLEKSIKVVHAEGPDADVGAPNTDQSLVLGYLPDITHYVSLEPIRYELDDFVAVCLESTRKKKHLYIAKVTEVDGPNVEVKFLKRKSDTEYIWPTVDDKDYLHRSEILTKLSNPELAPGRGLRLVFRQNDIDALKRYSNMSLD